MIHEEGLHGFATRDAIVLLQNQNGALPLDPGQTATVGLAITPDALSVLDERMNRVVEPGPFDIMVGSSSVDLKSVVLEVVGQ